MDEKALIGMLIQYEKGEVDRLQVLDSVLRFYAVDDNIANDIRRIFADCGKVKREPGKPKTVNREDVLIRVVAGKSYSEICTELNVSKSTVYRVVRDNQELLQKIKNEILGGN